MVQQLRFTLLYYILMRAYLQKNKGEQLFR